jgi:hypothetical protein
VVYVDETGAPTGNADVGNPDGNAAGSGCSQISTLEVVGDSHGDGAPICVRSSQPAVTCRGP